jgi:phospholipase C
MATRREFLKAASLLAGGVGMAGVIPESVKRAFAIEPTPGSTYKDAEHIVILMQENRSFDHALGALQGVRGFNDPRAIRQANGNSVFLQTNAAAHFPAFECGGTAASFPLTFSTISLSEHAAKSHI